MISADCSQSWTNLGDSLDVCSGRQSCCGWSFSSPSFSSPSFSSPSFSPSLIQADCGDRPATINNDSKRRFWDSERKKCTTY